MTANVGSDVVRAEFLLDELHGGEDGSLRAARAKARRTSRHGRGQRLHTLIVVDILLIGSARLVGQDGGRRSGQEAPDALEHDIGGVFAGLWQHALAEYLGVDVAGAAGWC